MFTDEDGLSNLMGMDEAMEQFIHKYVNSFVSWEIIQYCHENLGKSFQVADLAKSLNRPAEQIKSEVEELRKNDFLKIKKEGKKISYICDFSAARPAEKELLDLMNRFVTLCRSREGRLRVIYKILKDGKPLRS